MSTGDIANVEKRLMQTMDMIIMKKKRIAVVKKQNLEKISTDTKQSLLGFIYSVGQKRPNESNNFYF